MSLYTNENDYTWILGYNQEKYIMALLLGYGILMQQFMVIHDSLWIFDMDFYFLAGFFAAFLAAGFFTAGFFAAFLGVFGFLGLATFLAAGLATFLGDFAFFAFLAAGFLAFFGVLAFLGFGAFFAAAFLGALGFSPRRKLPAAPLPAT